MIKSTLLIISSLSSFIALTQFGPENMINTSANGAISIYCVDLDTDGDLDVVATRYTSKSVVWFENLGTGSVMENDAALVSIYPNPSAGLFNITSDQKISEISIYNILGERITNYHFSDNRTAVLDIRALANGSYYMIIHINDTEIWKKLIKVTH
ncbi:MAG: T9SS type A sorting domain-containing protein [Crocinitomicaceae bacterium]